MLSQILDSGVVSVQCAMETDQKLLQQLRSEGSLQLHFYEWDSPSLTHGYFLPVSKYIRVETWESEGGKIGRRPTGGGIFLHDQDFSFSLLVPRCYPLCQRPLTERYRVLQEWIRHSLISVFPALQETICTEGSSVAGPFCMAQTTTCDLVFAGQKIAGAAQRMTKQGMLYQATIGSHRWNKMFLGSILKDSCWIERLAQEPVLHPMTLAERQQCKKVLAEKALCMVC